MIGYTDYTVSAPNDRVLVVTSGHGHQPLRASHKRQLSMEKNDCQLYLGILTCSRRCLWCRICAWIIWALAIAAIAGLTALFTIAALGGA